MRKRFSGALWPIASLLLFLLAVWALHQELRDYRYHDIIQSLRGLSSGSVALALLFTALNYAVLTGYDALVLRYIERTLSYGKISLASFIGNPCSVTTSVFRPSQAAGCGSGSFRLGALDHRDRQGGGVLQRDVLGGTPGHRATFVLEPMRIPAQFHVPLRTSRSPWA